MHRKTLQILRKIPMYNSNMNIELPSSTAKTLERLRRSIGTTREEAVDRALKAYLEDVQSNRILTASNPVTQDMSEDDIYAIANAAVKQARAEKRH